MEKKRPVVVICLSCILLLMTVATMFNHLHIQELKNSLEQGKAHLSFCKFR